MLHLVQRRWPPAPPGPRTSYHNSTPLALRSIQTREDKEGAHIQGGANPGEAVELGPDRRRGSRRGVFKELEPGRSIPESRQKCGCDNSHRIS
jgi:hypothetical protein